MRSVVEQQRLAGDAVEGDPLDFDRHVGDDALAAAQRQVVEARGSRRKRRGVDDADRRTAEAVDDHGPGA